MEFVFIFQSTVNFLIVRHPFERLVSAFIDKIEHGNKLFFYIAYGEPIVRRFRKKAENITSAQVS